MHIAAEASKLAHYNNRSTITSREIQTYVRLLLPSELAKHAVSEGEEAWQWFGSPGRWWWTPCCSGPIWKPRQRCAQKDRWQSSSWCSCPWRRHRCQGRIASTPCRCRWRRTPYACVCVSCPPKPQERLPRSQERPLRLLPRMARNAKGVLCHLHLQGVEASSPRHRCLLQGHEHHEVLCHYQKSNELLFHKLPFKHLVRKIIDNWWMTPPSFYLFD